MAQPTTPPKITFYHRSGMNRVDHPAVIAVDTVGVQVGNTSVELIVSPAGIITLRTAGGRLIIAPEAANSAQIVLKQD